MASNCGRGLTGCVPLSVDPRSSNCGYASPSGQIDTSASTLVDAVHYPVRDSSGASAMLGPRKGVLYIHAMCALGGLLALVGLQALLGLNRRLPVIVELKKEDPPAKSDPPLASS